jgi:Mce-associated membrane protein
VGGRTRRRVPTLVLVGLLVVLTAAAVFFGIAGATLRSTPAARNTALVDVGTTAQVTQQLGDAVKTVYSYDFARLDQNEAAARAVILPAFAAQYDQLFGQVRTIAPQQQAVVTATIATSAAREIDGDKAVVVIFLDQQVTRAQAGDRPQQLAAAGRLTVTGRLVDGTWKIEDVQAE